MKSFEDDLDAWENCKASDRWVFNKLELSRRLGYLCGPTGIEVPKPDYYVVRPCLNLMGMGRGASFVFIEDWSDDVVPVGYFWCEIFKGRHLSIDYRFGEQTLAVEGFRDERDELYKFSLWKRVEDRISLPKIFSQLAENYEFINVEFIDGNPIEVHLRHNPDFTNSDINAIIPVWDEEGTKHPNFVSDPEFKRKGFIIVK